MGYHFCFSDNASVAQRSGDSLKAAQQAEPGVSVNSAQSDIKGSALPTASQKDGLLLRVH